MTKIAETSTAQTRNEKYRDHSFNTNADRDLRMAPAERNIAAGKAINDGHIEDATEEANLARLMREHKPSAIRKGTKPITVEVDGQQRSFSHITPSWILELTAADVAEMPRLPVSAWVEDDTWPSKWRPALNNPVLWAAILDGYFCIRCMWRYEDAPHPEDGCDKCKLSRNVRNKWIEYIEEIGDLQWSSSTPTTTLGV